MSELEAGEIGNWIREIVDRVNMLLLAHLGVRILTHLMSFLHCSLRPRSEGFKSQDG